jgi:hypothetical protein
LFALKLLSASSIAFLRNPLDLRVSFLFLDDNMGVPDGEKGQVNGSSSAAYGGAAWTESNPAPANIDRTHDVALDFLRAKEVAIDATLYLDPAYARRLRRKADKLVMPFLFIVYGVTFLDKVVLNVDYLCCIQLTFTNALWLVCTNHGHGEGSRLDRQRLFQRLVRLLHRGGSHGGAEW